MAGATGSGKAGMKMGMRTAMTQSTVMSPQMQQAIKLLSMTKTEVTEFIESEMESNPFLEMDTSAFGSEPDSPKLVLVNESNSGSAEHLVEKFQDIATPRNDSNPLTSSNHEDFYASDHLANDNETLHEFLEEQLSFQWLTPFELEIVLKVLQFVNDEGFFETDFKSLLMETELHEDDLRFAIECIHKCEPYGVGTFSVQESLQLQLKQKDNAPKHCADILKHCWQFCKKTDALKVYQKLFALGSFANVPKKQALEKIDIALEYIRKNLDPRPARQFGTSVSSNISPDVYVFKRHDKWVVSLNEDGLPRIKLSEKFIEESKKILEVAKESQSSEAEKKQDKQFLANSLNAAKWIQRVLSERNRSILRVMEAIVDTQQDFFEHGPQHLKPVTLKAIGDKIGLSESTISRCTSGKYVQIPGKLLELKYFFGVGLSSHTGEDIAGNVVKLWVEEAIKMENPAHPLSDLDISEWLFQEKKTNVARRTVAKYREALGIPTSSQRRRTDKKKGA